MQHFFFIELLMESHRNDPYLLLVPWGVVFDFQWNFEDLQTHLNRS